MKIFWTGDLIGDSGFGRIGNEVSKRLVMRGHLLKGAGVNYTGWENNAVPFHVYPLAGRDIWAELTNLVNQHQPDVVVMCQDFPYSVTLYRACRINWSKVAFLCITPVDGTPIEPDWLDLVDDIDGTMVISRFGVEAMRRQGRHVALCHPGVDTGHFKPATAAEKRELRLKAGIDPDAFVVGMFAMNQGRKNIPATLQTFFEFARDKPFARLLLDMEADTPGAGFNIPKICKQHGWDVKRIIFRAKLVAKGLLSLRDRYCLLDAHSVISFREGFGLPLLESMACGVPAVALDWCSGTEICGDGKGVLIPTFGPGRIGTWGGAQDFDPDMPALLAAFNKLFYEPGYRLSVAEKGYQWAIAQTWDNAAQAVDTALAAALEKHKRSYADLKAEAYSAIGERDRAGLQPTAVPDEVRQQPDDDGHAGAGGNPADRRLFAGLQPAGADGPAVPGLPQREQQGLRGDVQPGRAGSDLAAAVLPELGHDSPAGLVRANGERGA